MITIFEKNENDNSFSRLMEPKDGCWIHVEEASTNDISQISKITGIEYTDIYDSLDNYEVPRVERIEENVLIFARHPFLDTGTGIYTTTFTFVLTPNYFITICPQKSLIAENIISQKHKPSPLQKSKFLIFFLLKITQEYTLQIKKIRTSVLKQESRMTQVNSSDIVNLTKIEERLNQYLSSLIPIRNVLESVTSGKYTLLYEKDHDLLEDLLNATIQSEELCTINIRSIRSLRDSHQIIFTNQLNKTIKLLTALTIILSIPTMIASLYGMNVNLPLQNINYAFEIILVIIFSLSVFMFFIFQQKKWL